MNSTAINAAILTSFEIFDFYRNRKNNFKNHMETHRKLQIAKIILVKDKGIGIIFYYLKTYYKTTVMKTVQYWHNNKHTLQLRL